MQTVRLPSTHHESVLVREMHPVLISSSILVHHLIPKLILKRMKNSGKESVNVANYLIEVCRPCHNEIHRIWPHTELAKDYQTVDMILDAPAIQPYLNWKRKRERTA